MYENFVFEGGGIKGIAYVGALHQLLKEDMLSNVKRTAGTSAGAITALLLALRKSPLEIYDIVKQLNFTLFADDSFGLIRDFHRVMTEYGYHKGDTFQAWVQEILRKTTGNAQITFRELKERKFYADPYVVATNLTKQYPQIFNYKTTPDVPIATALRASMSIPLYYKTIKINDDIYVDGGVSMNYPIKVFDTDTPNKKTIGFRLDTKEEIELSQIKWNNKPKQINNFINYVKSLIDFMFEQANKRHLNAGDKARTVFIDTLDVRTTDFNLSDEKMNDLILQGEIAVENFLYN